jgi:hypothetical protein
MSFGNEILALVKELLAVDQDGDSFASAMRWQRITRAENANTGAVTETAATPVGFRGAMTDPLRTKLFGDSTLQAASTAVVAAGDAFAFVPANLDKVEVQPGRWLTVIDMKEIYGPGGAGSPVLVAYVAALGAS